MINQLQTEQFARHIGRHLIIFLVHHGYSRKNKEESIIHHNIMKIQDGEYGATSQGLLAIIKECPTLSWLMSILY